jgi:hypothetical protein
MKKVILTPEIRRQIKNNSTFMTYYNIYKHVEQSYVISAFNINSLKYGIIMNLSDYDKNYYIQILNQKSLYLNNITSLNLQEDFIEYFNKLNCSNYSYIT